MAKTTKAPKGRVAAAAMTANSSGSIGEGYSAAQIEKAMSDAVAKALADGVTDPKQHRKLILEARERVKARK